MIRGLYHSIRSNVGVIQVKHGSALLASVLAGNRQTLMAIYIVPNDSTFDFMECNHEYETWISSNKTSTLQVSSM